MAAATDQERSIAHAQYRLRFLGDPVLKMAARDVEPDTDVRDLIHGMKCILSGEKGVGIAAQQAGSIWRVALMCLSDGSFSSRQAIVTINPRIMARSKATVISPEEGCLSVQAGGRIFRTSKRRSAWVQLHYLDEQRNEHNVRLKGLDATIAQHECDHLEGICIVDGLSRQQRRQAERIMAKGAA